MLFNAFQDQLTEKERVDMMLRQKNQMVPIWQASQYLKHKIYVRDEEFGYIKSISSDLTVYTYTKDPSKAMAVRYERLSELYLKINNRHLQVSYVRPTLIMTDNRQTQSNIIKYQVDA